MNPLRVAQALALVLIGGVVRGDSGALIALVAVGLVTLARVVWDLAPAPRRRLVPSQQEARPPRFPGFDRAYSAVQQSRGSARQVDLALRPMLQRVLAAELEDTGPAQVRARIGERWWALVDPLRPTSSESNSGGLTQRDLRDLLDRLEPRA